MTSSLVVTQILARARELGIQLIAKGSVIGARPKGKTPPDLADAIRRHKAELLAYLAGETKARLAPPPESTCPQCGGRGPLSRSGLSGLLCLKCGRSFMIEPLTPGTPGMSTPLRRCDAPICATCGAHSPTPHRSDCAAPRYTPCGSRWWWLSVHDAIKCCACSAPATMDIVRGWLLAPDGDAPPSEVLSLMRLLN